MAKNIKVRKQSKVERPIFQPSMVISAPSLVIDVNGIAWWVDTEHNIIKKASANSVDS